MILELDHSHSPTPEKPIAKNMDRQAQSANMLTMLGEMLIKSESKLGQKGVHAVEKMCRFIQQKVYRSYSSNTKDYLSHLLNRNSVEAKDRASALLYQKQSNVATAINNEEYEIKAKPELDLKQMKSDLMEKIAHIKHDMEDVQDVKERERKEEQLYQNYMEFRKRGYWNEKNDKSENIKEFLKKMHKQKSQLRKNHEVDMQKRQQKDRKMREHHKQQWKKDLKQKIQKSLDKQAKLHKQRDQQRRQIKSRKNNIRKFLSQYKTDKPLYVLKEEQFKRDFVEPRNQEIKKKLEDIRKQRRPISEEQMEEHLRKYEQWRQKLQQVNLKRQEQQELYEKNQNQLKQLFHGHFHDDIQNEINNPSELNADAKRYRQKVQQYKDKVKSQYRPKIDPSKRKELEDLIRETDMQEDKSKRKKMAPDGSVVYEQKGVYDPKQIGRSYLNFLRKYNEGKPRKDPQDRSSSMMQLSKKPTVDYLRQNRPAKTKETLSGWRKVLDTSSLSSREQYNSVLRKLNIFEQQAEQKQVQMRNTRDKQKALEMKQELDKYYLETVAAKMDLLKEAILKQGQRQDQKQDKSTTKQGRSTPRRRKITPKQKQSPQLMPLKQPE